MKLKFHIGFEGWNFNGLETGKLSVHWLRASLQKKLVYEKSVEGFSPESISKNEIPTMKSYVNETEALLSFRPSWAKKRC